MASSSYPGSEIPSQESVDNKILSDLNTVVEKLDLCEHMLKPSASDPSTSVHDESLLQIVGFLEACAPRIVELVEAGAQGALSEHVLMKCLDVNDRLTKILEDVDTAALIETPASTTVASAQQQPTLYFNDLLLNDDTNFDDVNDSKIPPAAAMTGKSTGEDDPFGNEVLQTKQPAIEKTKSEDEFDSFFNERTAGPSG